MQVERDVLAPRPPRRTRWPAIDARAGDGENELSIVLGIARADCVPAQVVGLDISGLDRVRVRCRHGAGYDLNEYGIVSQGWESRVGGNHDRDSVRRERGNGLSESCGQSKKAGSTS